MSTFRSLGLAAPGPTGHPASPGDEYVLDVEPHRSGGADFDGYRWSGGRSDQSRNCSNG